MRVEMNLDIQDIQNIDSRIAEFKQDPEKMGELNGFVDEVLNEAQKSAEDKLQDKSAEDRPRNGNKLLSGLKQHRVVTRTRGIVLRIFEAICNCTNSATLPGQRPAAGAAPATANTATASTESGK
uniref:Putative odorant binding protein antennal n=1 Tax=Culex tarsalis TaxID=7177 RepID=A0A1Q3FTU8_CULTA